LLLIVNRVSDLVPGTRTMASARKQVAGPPRARGTRRQADILSQTRREHAHESTEDYVEAIADLIAEGGEARVVDLAERLGVTHVTVNRTIARLQKTGHVTSLPYRAIFLTDTGRELAATCKSRHQAVVAFLRSLGISERVAERDAEGMEHHVSPETLAAFKAALRTARH
jgi:DtxR family transcriptional regulator, manganese transport regulator